MLLRASIGQGPLIWPVQAWCYKYRDRQLFRGGILYCRSSTGILRTYFPNFQIFVCSKILAIDRNVRAKNMHSHHQSLCAHGIFRANNHRSKIWRFQSKEKWKKSFGIMEFGRFFDHMSQPQRIRNHCDFKESKWSSLPWLAQGWICILGKLNPHGIQ